LKKVYDIAIIGAGIAGVSVAYQAKFKGLSVVLIEKDNPISNASLAAGAFLSPKFGPKSSYNELINRAFLYSIEFYGKNFRSFLNECGMLRVARSVEERDKCDSYAKNSDFWQKNKDGYWCKKAGLISPQVMFKMSEFADDYVIGDGSSFFYENEIWNIAGFMAKHLVLSCGFVSLINEPYIRIKPIFGQKLEVRADKGFDFCIHRKCSVSPFVNGIVHIGASHMPNWRYNEDVALFANERKKLLSEAEDILGQKVEFISESRGFRSATTDFFPYCGQVIDTKKTLMKFPNLIHGVNIDKKEFAYRPNLWIHQGHGARGFVLAPYTAKYLIDEILGCDSKETDILPTRAFMRYVRRSKM
jgi:tRNA 5-methylaminomethyl-2-thiouridine biosynthesis bifunctional protein